LTLGFIISRVGIASNSGRYRQVSDSEGYRSYTNSLLESEASKDISDAGASASTQT